MASQENVVVKAPIEVFLQPSTHCKEKVIFLLPTKLVLSPSAPTAPLVFLMNSLLDILFFTWGELRSTESRIKEKHITYLIRVNDWDERDHQI